MPEISKIRDRIMKYLKGNCILDLGVDVEKVTPNCIGIDLKFCSEAVNLICDATNLYMFCDESVDAVVASHILEDIKDTKGALIEWLRVIVKDGYLIIYMPDKRWYPNVGHPLANKGHLRDWSKEDVMEIMDKIGLAKLIHKEDCPPPDGKYDYENRGKIEYSFLLIYQKL